MRLNNIHSVYFIGIGGIGMSALARWFKANGRHVSGYDRTKSELTSVLESEGIDIFYEDKMGLLPDEILEDRSKVLIVYTPAIPNDHVQYGTLKDRGYTIMKRSQVLGLLTESMFTIAVAGTHGKTTTSSIVAHLLKSAGRDCTAFVGGIMTNYGSNVIIGDSEEGALMVVEADEFDRSFLTLHPDVAIITAVDADHLDIYGTGEALKESFNEFIQNIKKSGKLFVQESVATKIDLSGFDGLDIATYGLNKGDIVTEDLKINNGRFQFNYVGSDMQLDTLNLGLPGFHNVENAIAAISAGIAVGLTREEIAKGIEDYSGVKRRFEYIIDTPEMVFIDDYAHHPVEIEALMHSAKKMFPDKKITAVFQPHLYSRTRDFADGFSKALSMADETILLDIYPARELPIQGVTSEMLLDNMSNASKSVCRKEDLISSLEHKTFDVLLTMGAGDIDRMVLPIKEMLIKKI